MDKYLKAKREAEQRDKIQNQSKNRMSSVSPTKTGAVLIHPREIRSGESIKDLLDGANNESKTPHEIGNGISKKNGQFDLDSDHEYDSEEQSEDLIKGNLSMDEQQCEMVLKTNPFDKWARLRLSQIWINEKRNLPQS